MKHRNIETRCQELARELNMLARREIKHINYPKLSSLVASSMKDLTSKSADYRWKVFEFVGSFVGHCLGLDPNCLAQTDKGSTTEIEYTGCADNEKEGFRAAYSRDKLISSVMSSKLIGAYVTERKDIPKELGGYPLAVKDSFAFRILADHPDTPPVDWVGIHDAQDIDELLDIIEENRADFETSGSSLDDYLELSKKGFEDLFEKFSQAYQERFEGKNEENLHLLAMRIQENLPDGHFELINVADFPVVHMGRNDRRHHATAASQEFIMPGDPAGEMAIHQDFLVFDAGDDDGVKSFSDSMKSSAQDMKSGFGSGISYETIGEAESEGIKRGVHVKLLDQGSQYIICQLKEQSNIFIGFRGSLANKNFKEEIFGSKDKGRDRGKNKKGLLEMTLAGNRAHVREAFALRFTAVETPLPYNIDHYTDAAVLHETYGVRADKDRKANYFKDYVAYPRAMIGPDGNTIGYYKAKHFVVKIKEQGFDERLELQLRTSWQNFQSVRGAVSNQAYELEKISRSDPRKSKKALEDVQGTERKKVCTFLNELERAIFEEYERRIDRKLEDIESLFLGLFSDESGLYSRKEKKLNSIISEIVHEYRMLMNESIEFDRAKLTEKVSQAPYHLIEIVPSLNGDAESFIRDLCKSMKKGGFNVPQNISYYMNYKNMRSVVDAFVKYASQRSEEKSYFISLQAIAMFLEGYAKSVPRDHAEALQNISRYERIRDDESFFIKHSIELRQKGITPPRKILPFVPNGLNGSFNNKQIGKARIRIEELLSSYKINRDIIRTIETTLDDFIKEVGYSRKRPYNYILGPDRPR